MFTGLIETTGSIEEIRPGSKSIHIGIRPSKSDFAAQIGASIAIDGVCLTVEQSTNGVLFFTAVKETLARTTLTSVTRGRVVNLERALQLGSRLDGHMVQGHVDATGTILSDSREGDSLLRTISVPENLSPFMAEKGSVAIDGISLTIAQSTASVITISFIPHTLSETTMGIKRPGERVNIECDLIARYLLRLVATGAVEQTGTHEPLLSRMERLGY